VSTRGAIERVLDRRARKHVGIAVGVRRGDETVLVGRGRVADDRPQAPDERTIFEIGSITKVITATLLADMAREGLVRLDDPVQRHLPDGVVIPVRGRPITLADLASHTSGLPRLPKGLLRRALREGSNPYSSLTVDDLNAAIPVTKPRREPGRKIRYSNYGVGLLGHVLSTRAGKPYEELVHERITGPLGMTDTSIAVSDDKLARFAQGHSRRGKRVSNWDLPALAGAGALRSTVADLLTFLDAQVGQAPPGLADAMHATQAPRAGRRGLSVGLGWMILGVKGQPGPVVFHDGGTGGYRSVAGFVAESGTRVVVLSNSGRPVDRIGLEILKELPA
jgi:serine-type D-Ala-D-Ala carboxypeptidase/endopeptidase